MPIVYSGRVFSVEVDKVRFPNGSTHAVSIVRHRPSVVLLPMMDARHVILIRQYRPSIQRELWELPAGSLNADETPEAAAARECEEEIRLVPGRIERLRGLYPAPGFCDEQLIYFRVSELRLPDQDSTVRPDEDEDIHVQTFTVERAREMAARQEIVDLKTAYGLTMI